MKSEGRETLPASEREPFGTWLIAQHAHERDWIANLARTAKTDPRFPRGGSPDDMRKHLTSQGADGDAFEALDDAEAEWS